MNFSSNFTDLRLISNFTDNLPIFNHRNRFQIHGFRVHKRRPLKLSHSNLTVQNHLNFSFDNNFFQNLPSLDFIAPALCLTSGVALYLSSRLRSGSSGRGDDNKVCEIGEWILYTSPMPFNRLIILRCPSISSEGNELTEETKERLVKEDSHLVRLNRGRMLQASRKSEKIGTELEYQRVCIGTEDGGVVSIDWPANLNLKEDNGLDTTVLVVPGTAEGIMDEKVKEFVKEVVSCGLFPVVMNPRGCACSPLTTPRLFTAADSDDVYAAIQFISKVRPSSTLMGIGWGYGANMLTKYLAEAGEVTPLTAAICIDNPFDLEEATRSSPYQNSLNEKLTGGLIDILQSNKELFQGREKGFDVEKALSAKSLRDFEKAISMVSYGFEAIEDFYAKSSTQSLVGNVKIPVLFIQNDDGSVPLFSVPRGLIAENPFTSLLFCSCSPSRATVSWCHHLTIEWLKAVELGLLKGHHPLLEDVDVTINPSKSLAFVEARLTGKGDKVKKLLNLSRSNSINGYSIGPTTEMSEGDDTIASIHRRSRQYSQQMSNHQVDIYSSVKKDTDESGKIDESDKLTREMASMHVNSGKTGSETSSKPNLTPQAEKTCTRDKTLGGEWKANRDGEIDRNEINFEIYSQKEEENVLDFLADQNQVAFAAAEDVIVSSAGYSEAQPMEEEENDDREEENKNLQQEPDQNKSMAPDSNPPSFSVFQALDALSGKDDSTQVAVNSVFGVIENMISHLEEEKGENDSRDGYEVKIESIDYVRETKDTFEKKEESENEQKLREHKARKNDQSMIPKGLHDPPIHSGPDLQYGSTIEWWKEESPQYHDSLEETDTDYSKGSTKQLSRNNGHLVGDKFVADSSDNPVKDIPLYINANKYEDFREYFSGYFLSKRTTKPLDLDTTTVLLLDYYPEERRWKLLEQQGVNGDSTDGVTTCSRDLEAPVGAEVGENENHIEPSYAILNTGRQYGPVGQFESMENMNLTEIYDDGLEGLMQMVKVTILDSLRVEVDHRLSSADIKGMESQLAIDIETVAIAGSLSIRDGGELTDSESKGYVTDNASDKVVTVNRDNVVRAISSSVQRTSYLRRVMPVSVIIGSSLTALRKYFYLSSVQDNDQSEAKAVEKTKISREKNHDKTTVMDIDETGKNGTFHRPTSEKGVETGLESLNKDLVVVGAVTAALGTSALMVPEQGPVAGKGTEKSSSKTVKEKGNQQIESEKPDEAVVDKHQTSIVNSLAEKALSAAASVVPTKEGCELDQERLVVMLADLGNRGGVLRLVGKVALLWAGIRGAMSLTDKLITFLHVAELPLYQRILAFVGMGLVLWSPVTIPLLPTFVRSWTTNNPSKTAEVVSIFGFYTALMILVMLWGKRIRGYENPLEEYGLDLTSSSKILSVLMGLIGGVILVALIQTANALLGFVGFSWPSKFVPPSLDFMDRLNVYGKLLVLAVQGTITATGVMFVEELLFRSWLPDEIATDLGHHWAIIISGLAFSLFQRSLMAIPGVWLLSLTLAGIRQRNHGSLSIPLGLRTGIMASSFVLQTGGFLFRKATNFHPWVAPTYSIQPFSGLVGLAFALFLAIVLYPRQPPQRNRLKNTKRKINRNFHGSVRRAEESL